MADVSARAHFVGFANFPNQVFRRAVKNGFEFSLMVVGRSGLGKSTFLKTFLQAELTDPQDMPMDKGGQTTRITQRSMRLVENGVTLTLHLVDTPGFGDALDNTKCWEPIAQFVDDQFNAYFAEETRVERAGQLPDRRVHLCLYFIEPNGHGLKPLDVEFMRNLHTRVNLLPVIAKADCFTADELAAFKEQVLRDIQRHDLKVYDFPPTDNADEKSMSLEPLRRRFPFAVVGSTKVCEVQGHRVRVRQYPWGQCEVDNLEHNDFLALRDVLIRNSLADLVEITNDVHYENFRFRQMTRATNSGRSTPLSKMKNPFAELEEERREWDRTHSRASIKQRVEQQLAERVARQEQRRQDIARLKQTHENHAKALKHDRERLFEEVNELRNGGRSTSTSSLHSSAAGQENVLPPSYVAPSAIVKKRSGTLSFLQRSLSRDVGNS